MNESTAGRLPAWSEGFRAGNEGKNRYRVERKCPYPALSREAWAWHCGWIEGEAKREGFSYSNPIQRLAEKAGQQCS